MKNFLFISFLFIAFISFQRNIQAKNQAFIYLLPKQNTPVVNKNLTVDVMIKDISLVYGVTFQISINSEFLEVMDSDIKKDGIQIEPGSFFSSYAYFLKNEISSEGLIDYAMTQLNPAESIQGGGVLATITFNCKLPGSTTIKIEKAQFGTRDGLTFIPSIDPEKTINIITNGDFNGDNIINLADTIMAFQVLTSINISNPPHNFKISDLDINHDGKFGVVETLYILRTMAYSNQ